MKRTLRLECAAALLTASVCGGVVHAAMDPGGVIENYADIAHAMYEDSLSAARELDAQIGALLDAPGPATLSAARTAWINSRVPYMHTEVYRFGNVIVDDWEGKVNAWPLDEGLIDYVDPGYGTASDENPLYVANVVGNEKITFGGEMVDASEITSSLLTEMHEIGGVEANVATGYHAIEFLLWGQDLNGTDAGSGERSWTDFATGGDCTNGNCERRRAYLATTSTMLVDELEWMTAQWAEGGAARQALADGGPDAGLSTILTGLGSLSYGELAGERMQLGLLLHDPEEEHDCFADNTHNSHYYDVMGMVAVYHGGYTRTDGSKVSGPSLSDLVSDVDAALDEEMSMRLDATQNAMASLKARAETVEAYDQMLGEGNAEGNAVVQAAIDRLTEQTRTIEQVVAALGLEAIEVEGSDSLDNPEAVFE